jgi:hypothetical protein
VAGPHPEFWGVANIAIPNLITGKLTTIASSLPPGRQKNERLKTMKPQIPSRIEYVHLQWDGPITWAEKDELDSAVDYGVYQIYGCHPVHGADCLLYIGKASDQRFAARLKQEVDWMYDADFGRLNIYVGRCSGWDGTPRDPEWARQIDLSEKLLILVRITGQGDHESEAIPISSPK